MRKRRPIHRVLEPLDCRALPLQLALVTPTEVGPPIPLGGERALVSRLHLDQRLRLQILQLPLLLLELLPPPRDALFGLSRHLLISRLEHSRLFTLCMELLLEGEHLLEEPVLLLSCLLDDPLEARHRRIHPLLIVDSLSLDPSL